VASSFRRRLKWRRSAAEKTILIVIDESLGLIFDPEDGQRKLWERRPKPWPGDTRQDSRNRGRSVAGVRLHIAEKRRLATGDVSTNKASGKAGGALSPMALSPSFQTLVVHKGYALRFRHQHLLLDSRVGRRQNVSERRAHGHGQVHLLADQGTVASPVGKGEAVAGQGNPARHEKKLGPLQVCTAQNTWKPTRSWPAARTMFGIAREGLACYDSLGAPF